jgi:hypothetical protein
MTTPANPPSAAILQSLAGDRAPIFATSVAASTAVDLTTKVAWPNAANAPPCAAELLIVSGTSLVAQLAGDSAMQTYTVTAGQVLKGAWVLVSASNGASLVARF